MAANLIGPCAKYANRYLVAASAAAAVQVALPPARQFVQLFVPVALPSLLGLTAPLRIQYDHHMETWLSHGGVGKRPAWRFPRGNRNRWLHSAVRPCI
jgi:hypothetical protein